MPFLHRLTAERFTFHLPTARGGQHSKESGGHRRRLARGSGRVRRTPPPLQSAPRDRRRRDCLDPDRKTTPTTPTTTTTSSTPTTSTTTSTTATATRTTAAASTSEIPTYPPTPGPMTRGGPFHWFGLMKNPQPHEWQQWPIWFHPRSHDTPVSCAVHASFSWSVHAGSFAGQ